MDNISVYLLSVIIPCYNCAQTILPLLSQLEKQIWQRNVEIILIDDGSTDETSTIIAEFKKKINSDKIKTISDRNEGAAVARTKGLRIAKGQYVAFIDSDDYIADNYIDKILASIERDGADIVYFSSAQKSGISEALQAKINFEKDELLENGENFVYTQLLRRVWSAAVWTFVFKREMPEKFDAHFTNRVAHEDHLFTLKIVANAKDIKVITDILYIQNITVGSLTNSVKSVSFLEDRYDAYKEAMSYIGENLSKRVARLYQSWSLDQCVGISAEVFGTKRLCCNIIFLKYALRRPDLMKYFLKKQIYDYIKK